MNSRFVPVVIALLMLISSIPHEALGFSLSARPDNVYQGDAFLIIVASSKNVEEPPNAAFTGNDIPLRRIGTGLYVGLSSASSGLSEGEHRVEATISGVTKQIMLIVRKKEFPVDRLTLPPDRVTLSPENEQRADREAARLSRIWPVSSTSWWSRDFVLPLEGGLGAGFGERRILNGIEKSPHNGIDIKADRGTPVGAVNSGSVVIADDLFFGGNTIVLDHGEGLYSFYMHLDSFAVTKGDRVPRSGVIGYVGSTGRSTGPHLHMGMKLRGTNVNPLSVIGLEVEAAIKEKR